MALKDGGLEDGGLRELSQQERLELILETLEASDIDAEEAVLNGEIDIESVLQGLDAEVYFEWGESGSGFPNATTPITRGSPGEFDDVITNLNEDTEYEFRAAGDLAYRDAVGTGQTFTTDPIPDSVVDNFEEEPDGPYGGGETLSEFWSGSPSSYSFATDTVFDGSRSLENDDKTSPGARRIWSLDTDGLPHYPEAGDVWVLHIWFESGSDVGDLGRFGPYFGTQDAQDGDSYYISLQTRAGEFQIGRLDNGSSTTLADTTLTGADIPTGKWLRFRCVWETDGDITAEFQSQSGGEWSNIVSVSTNDTTYADGGVGWIQGTDSADVDYRLDDWLVGKGIA